MIVYDRIENIFLHHQINSENNIKKGNENITKERILKILKELKYFSALKKGNFTIKIFEIFLFFSIFFTISYYSAQNSSHDTS